jgi:DNA-binding CsgD family transcriptional regulator/tetratricopeptide (TPR) repeat protein
MPITLLERDTALDELHQALSRTRNGQGQTVLLAGAPGIGKSSLVEGFVQCVRAATLSQGPQGMAAKTGQGLQVLWGGCEALSTPRPLGPLYDMAAQSPAALAQALQDTPQAAAILDALQSLLLQSHQPTLLVFEDLHWADHATLDVVQLLGRRVARLPALLVLTYRDEPGHNGSNLQRCLAALPPASTSRIVLQPLSPAAVATLAAHDQRTPEHLFELTQGNPFYLSEVLAFPNVLVPTSVHEAVLTHVHALPEMARRVCELVSVVPGTAAFAASVDLLGHLFSKGKALQRADALDACIHAGVLLQDDTGLRFRHELARLAVEETLLPQRKRALHAAVLELLLQQPHMSNARLVHHAAQAGLADMVLALAPKAAQDATRHGAHSEALAHFAAALPYLAQALPALQAHILEGWATAACATTGPDAQAVQAMERAIALWRAECNTQRLAGALQQLADMFHALWQIPAALRCVEEAIDLLKTSRLHVRAASAVLVEAYNQRAHFYMEASQTEQALTWGDRAMALARQLHPGVSAAGEAHALAITGAALLRAGVDEGATRLRTSLAQQTDASPLKPQITAYLHLAESSLRHYQLASAEAVCAEALARFRDSGYTQHYFLGLQAHLALVRGRYAEAMARADVVLSRLHGPLTVMQWPLLLAAGLARSRSGTPGGLDLLQQCYAMSLGFSPHYLLPAGVALAEAQLLHGDLPAAQATLLQCWQQRGFENSPWLIGAVRTGAYRLGVALPNADQVADAAVAKPFALELAGDHANAAAYWAAAGAPYEQAYNLMHCTGGGSANGANGVNGESSVEAVQQAISVWASIGAHPAESRARAEARQRGLRGIRRGPYSAARSNPMGLSARELQILHLLSEGHSNAHIAQQLTRSERTIEHHVSRMLAKVGAPHRVALVAHARHAGLLNDASSVA